jgi:hypothetical protein
MASHQPDLAVPRQLTRESARLFSSSKYVWSAPPRKAENDDRGGFAPMYPASREWADFSSQAVMKSARRVPEY